MSVIHVAYEVLDTIKEAVERDQGARFRTLLRKYMPLAEDAYRGEESGFREHMGASLIGKDCARDIWYSYNWVYKATNEDRIIRLFNRGHLEEPRMLALLECAGYEVLHVDTERNQFKVSALHGHFGGSLDCVLKRTPYIGGSHVLGEFKTHAEKSFSKLAGDKWKEHRANPLKVQFNGKGVREAKFEHYVQMQIYMGLGKLEAAIYLAVNKNNDSLYAELVMFDVTIFDAYLERAYTLIHENKPPRRINEEPSWWRCKFCSHRGPCHESEIPAVNCRTCDHSIPDKRGELWYCKLHQTQVTKLTQLTGCSSYSLRASLRHL